MRKLPFGRNFWGSQCGYECSTLEAPHKWLVDMNHAPKRNAHTHTYILWMDETLQHSEETPEKTPCSWAFFSGGALSLPGFSPTAPSASGRGRQRLRVREELLHREPRSARSRRPTGRSSNGRGVTPRGVGRCFHLELHVGVPVFGATAKWPEAWRCPSIGKGEGKRKTLNQFGASLSHTHHAWLHKGLINGVLWQKPLTH